MLRYKHRFLAAAMAAGEFGAPAEVSCTLWPHTNCTRWSLPGGVDLHAFGEVDGPYVSAYLGLDDTARAATLCPSRFRSGPVSLREWLGSVGMAPSGVAP